MTLLAVFFPANTTQLFSQSLSAHTLCSCLEIFSTTINLCSFWRRKFQQVSSYAFCNWDLIFTKKWICSSPKSLCKCTVSPSTFSTKSFREWNLYLSSSNHIVAPFMLEMNVGGFPKHHNNKSDTARYKRDFFTSLVSQVRVNTMKRTFEQRSGLQVAKCLTVHVLSRSSSVTRL